MRTCRTCGHAGHADMQDMRTCRACGHAGHADMPTCGHVGHVDLPRWWSPALTLHPLSWGRGKGDQHLAAPAQWVQSNCWKLGLGACARRSAKTAPPAHQPIASNSLSTCCNQLPRAPSSFHACLIPQPGPPAHIVVAAVPLTCPHRYGTATMHPIPA